MLVYVKNFLHLLVTFLVIAVCRYLHTSFVSTTFSTQPQTLLVFLQSQAGSNNQRDKTKSCKHESHEGVKVLVKLTNIWFPLSLIAKI